jgi:hypothetical protein
VRSVVVTGVSSAPARYQMTGTGGFSSDRATQRLVAERAGSKFALLLAQGTERRPATAAVVAHPARARRPRCPAGLASAHLSDRLSLLPEGGHALRDVLGGARRAPVEGSRVNPTPLPRRSSRLPNTIAYTTAAAPIAGRCPYPCGRSRTTARGCQRREAGRALRSPFSTPAADGPTSDTLAAWPQHPVLRPDRTVRKN